MFVICHIRMFLFLWKQRSQLQFCQKSLRSITRLFVLVNDLPHCFTLTPKVKQCKISTCPLFIREKVWLYTLIKFSFFSSSQNAVTTPIWLKHTGLIFFIFFQPIERAQNLNISKHNNTKHWLFFWKMGSWHDTFVMDCHEMMKEHNMSTIFLYKMP